MGNSLSFSENLKEKNKVIDGYHTDIDFIMQNLNSEAERIIKLISDRKYTDRGKLCTKLAHIKVDELSDFFPIQTLSDVRYKLGIVAENTPELESNKKRVCTDIVNFYLRKIYLITTIQKELPKCKDIEQQIHNNLKDKMANQDLSEDEWISIYTKLEKFNKDITKRYRLYQRELERIRLAQSDSELRDISKTTLSIISKTNGICKNYENDLVQYSDKFYISSPKSSSPRSSSPRSFPFLNSPQSPPQSPQSQIRPQPKISKPKDMLNMLEDEDTDLREMMKTLQKETNTKAVNKEKERERERQRERERERERESNNREKERESNNREKEREYTNRETKMEIEKLKINTQEKELEIRNLQRQLRKEVQKEQSDVNKIARSMQKQNWSDSDEIRNLLNKRVNVTADDFPEFLPSPKSQVSQMSQMSQMSQIPIQIPLQIQTPLQMQSVIQTPLQMQSVIQTPLQTQSVIQTPLQTQSPVYYPQPKVKVPIDHFPEKDMKKVTDTTTKTILRNGIPIQKVVETTQTPVLRIDPTKHYSVKMHKGYVAMGPNQLTLAENTEVIYMGTSKNNWARVKTLAGQEGYVPSTYLSKV